VSEGRDAALLRALGEACVPARLLDLDAGWDAHRSVLTLDGELLQDGLFHLARLAVSRIDLNRHRGIHRRMGAIDVIPVVPLDGNVLRAEAMADELSRRIAAELALPVFRYGIGYRALPEVRGKGFEDLPSAISRHPPEHGPHRPHPTAGAVAVGVRHVLVAFNVSLDGSDLSLARRVAREIRASSGGMPGVQALGWLADSLGCAQVSCNLLDWRASPPHAVLEAVRARAPVRGCELVGMIPLGAVEAAAAFYGVDLAEVGTRMGLGLHKPFTLQPKVLEYRMARVPS
jgi:glutamate formiminotransferase